MNGARGTHGRDDKFTEQSGSENLKGGNISGCADAGGRTCNEF